MPSNDLMVKIKKQIEMTFFLSSAVGKAFLTPTVAFHFWRMNHYDRLIGQKDLTMLSQSAIEILCQKRGIDYENKTFEDLKNELINWAKNKNELNIPLYGLLFKEVLNSITKNK